MTTSWSGVGDAHLLNRADTRMLPFLYFHPEALGASPVWSAI